MGLTDTHSYMSNNKNFIYSTGNYSQYLVITYNGRESEKEYIYIQIYVQLNRFAVYLELTVL